MAQSFSKADLQDAKRELIKLGLDQGYVTQGQIADYLPVEHMSETEMEMMRFTFETMGISLVEQPDENQ